MDTEHVCASQLSHFDHVDEFMSNLDIILTTTCIKQSTQALERLMTIVSFFFQ